MCPGCFPPPSTHSPLPEWVEIESGILNWYLVCSFLMVAAALGVCGQLYLCLYTPQSRVVALTPASALLFMLIKIRLTWSHRWWLEDSFT